MKLAPIPIPPHFVYFCMGCEQRFGSAERGPWAEPSRDAFQPYYCAQCAETENIRRYPALTTKGKQ